MGSRTATLLQPVQKSLGSSIPGALALLFVITSFLSAFLLFQVQLIVSKHILPWFGGTAAVWTTCMLVFQLLLLAGYVYSHLISAKLSPAAQTRLHLGLLAVALLVVLVLSILWPSAVTPGRNWKLEGGSPVLRVALLIMLATGLPFFVLSTTGPLLQSWYARLGGGTRAYKLYAISNLGSFLGLLTFPFLLEPTFRLRTLGLTWSVLFAGFIAVCGLGAWNARNASHEASLPAEGKLVVSHGTGAVAVVSACSLRIFLTPRHY